MGNLQYLMLLLLICFLIICFLNNNILDLKIYLKNVHTNGFLFENKLMLYTPVVLKVWCETSGLKDKLHTTRFLYTS